MVLGEGKKNNEKNYSRYLGQKVGAGAKEEIVAPAVQGGRFRRLVLGAQNRGPVARELGQLKLPQRVARGHLGGQCGLITVGGLKEGVRARKQGLRRGQLPPRRVAPGHVQQRREQRTLQRKARFAV